jgi:hypothetical protein
MRLLGTFLLNVILLSTVADGSKSVERGQYLRQIRGKSLTQEWDVQRLN